MKEMSQQSRWFALRVKEYLARHRFQLEIATLLFVLASALDVATTQYMITHGATGISFVESNPIARYFLDSWGIAGLAWFKFSLVAVVVTICQIIARRKVDVARRVLHCSSVLVLGVVFYSISLLVRNT
jgi:Domain of unknown function (DUF5658)